MNLPHSIFQIFELFCTKVSIFSLGENVAFIPDIPGGIKNAIIFFPIFESGLDLRLNLVEIQLDLAVILNSKPVLLLFFVFQGFD